jgi:hypothetical protein
VRQKREKETWWLDQKDPVEFMQLGLAAKKVDRFGGKSGRSETDESYTDVVRAVCRFDDVVGERPPSAALWKTFVWGTPWDRNLSRYLVKILDYIEHGKADPAED